jgi:hypothetical protein
VLKIVTDVSEESVASIFRVEEEDSGDMFLRNVSFGNITVSHAYGMAYRGLLYSSKPRFYFSNLD